MSVEPDVVVVTHESLETGRVTLVPNAADSPDQFIELEGSPDLVVEVVSDSSVAKDLRRLPPLYFAAGVTELWLADARGDILMFQIHLRGDAGFVAQRPDNDGYQFSPTYKRSFRLDRSRNRLGHWQFDLVTK